MIDYSFGAGGFKLGERVEVLLTEQKGILVAEIVLISGCNTYAVLLPNVLLGGKKTTTHRDHLMLRKLDDSESILDGEIKLTAENSFSPKGTDVNAEWIREAVIDRKEPVPEIDDAVGVEEISIRPGMEVWNKVYGKTMIVSHICREIFSKELRYGAVHMVDDREVITFYHTYALVPLEHKIEVPSAPKLGSMFEDGRDMIEYDSGFDSGRFSGFW